jgi:hypothetical protein
VNDYSNRGTHGAARATGLMVTNQDRRLLSPLAVTLFWAFVGISIAWSIWAPVWALWPLNILTFLILRAIWCWWYPTIDCRHCDGKQRCHNHCGWCQGAGSRIRWEIRLIRRVVVWSRGA